ncbi:hypothetical protein QBC46DRAFT_399728 [Diplogelasinospora grovesii]|uniref:Uncharacterized protein n=1 Tax=Diplogelasinospora grovesii TaxID=303347 RepID=A0AAN6RZR1_9PEZI|nr:hypothetical protein QBC46DRAFT_399728 [Diplogelasinospora grovesii]
MADLAGIPKPIQPPYPTLAALRAAKQAVLPSAAGGKLLFWPLDGPTLETSGLAVMASPTNPDVRAPYYNATTGVWHPVSQLPISEPRVSSITVHVSELQYWEDNWEDMHCEHVAGDEGDDDGDAGGDECCGTARPVGKKDASVVVTGTGGVTEGGGGGGDFVTVHDYVMVVHPWLMGLRSDILGALGTLNGDDAPLPAETELMVSCNALDDLMMQTRAEWIRLTKKEPVAPPPGYSLRELMARNGRTNFGLFRQ